MRSCSSVFAVLPLFCLGQGQASTWYFGADGAGLRFYNNCQVRVLTDGTINGFEGCATVSDAASGAYLFCTNSDQVWDRNGEVMPGSDLTANGNTITQVTIVQKPGASHLYYIFTSEVQSFSGEGYRFHGVDMTLNGGAGGMAFTDSVLYTSPVTEKITAIRHANGTDVWLVGHAYGSDAFLAFRVTSAGVSTVPVVSHIGKVHSDVFSNTMDAIGELKASPDGSKLVAVTMYRPDIELFSFNNATGVLSDLITLPENGASDAQGNASSLYGASFSPSGNMLYVSQWFNAAGPARLLQYDVSSNDPQVINSTRTEIPTAGNPYSLKLAPDGKIYVAHAVMDTHLGVIRFPESAGTACEYADDGVYLEGRHSSWGLNNMMEYLSPCDPSVSMDEPGAAAPVTVYPNPCTDGITVTLGHAGPAYFVLYDLSGRTLSSTVFKNTLSLDVRDLAPGMYLYRVVMATGRDLQGKMRKD